MGCLPGMIWHVLKYFLLSTFGTFYHFFGFSGSFRGILGGLLTPRGQI